LWLIVSSDSQYSDGKTTAFAVQTLRNVSVAAKAETDPTPFFVAVGTYDQHRKYVVYHVTCAIAVARTS